MGTGAIRCPVLFGAKKIRRLGGGGGSWGGVYGC